ncbi:BQ2448_4391 [Microbotryum intermedium]|uniref:BQ2448_4391 protein n=1 Tax=Microbotryum intermedium TaxID=269621 RepID=A0A238FLV9_9BASI|nr:BQ2448_4391 [Microbotryum intermedium]
MRLNIQASTLYIELQRQRVKRDKVDPAQLKALLNQLKIHLAESGLLFPTAPPMTSQEVADMVIARELPVRPYNLSQAHFPFHVILTGDALEYGALLSIQTEDVPSFERYMALLSSFYTEPSQVLTQLQHSHLEESKHRAALSALSLLRLLSQNRIAEFHTTLETLSSSLIQSKEITWVLEVSHSAHFPLSILGACPKLIRTFPQLERSLMEGSYSKVYSLCSNRSNLPRVEFKYFISTLLSTVRSEIASCDERAYATLPLRDAQTLLFFSNEAEVRTFAKERGWDIDEKKGVIRFGVDGSKGKGLSSDAHGLGGDKEMNKERVVASVVGYAKELESIV